MRTATATVLLFVLGVTAALAAETGLTDGQAAALRAIARGESFAWPEITGEQAAGLHGKAEEALRVYQTRHLPHGLHCNVWWNDYDRSGVDSLEGCGDSVCWTGHYLAALAFKYSVTKDQPTLDAIIAVIDKIDMLSRVSGREGFIARYAGPATDEGYKKYYERYGKADPDRPGFGVKAYPGVEPFADLVWLGHSSRDSYDGVNLGLSATWKYVGVPEVRDRIRTLVERVGDRLIADGFAVIDGKGNQWGAQDTFKASWLRTMLSVSPEKYGELDQDYGEALREFGERQPISQYHEQYFSNNLVFVRIAAIAMLESDPERLTFVRDTVRGWYTGHLQDDLNAHFSAMYLLITGDDAPAARAVVQGMLVDYPALPKWVRLVDHRERTDIEKHDERNAAHAFLTHERVPDEFLWQQPPGLLYQWDRSIPLEMPGVDIFLPYWMGRVAGAVPAPGA